MFDCGGPSAEPEKPPNRAGILERLKKIAAVPPVPKRTWPPRFRLPSRRARNGRRIRRRSRPQREGARATSCHGKVNGLTSTQVCSILPARRIGRSCKKLPVWRWMAVPFHSPSAVERSLNRHSVQAEHLPKFL